MAEQQGVYILAEVTEDGKPAPLTLELMGLGRELASKLDEKLCAVLCGSGLSPAAEELAAYGAEEVFVLDDEALASYNPDIYLPVLKKLFSE